MWLQKDNKKPMSIKKLLQTGFNAQQVEPEPLVLACPITNGLAEKQLEWIMELENLANESDPYTVEINLKRLLDKVV